jgi:hypothetical protein
MSFFNSRQYAETQLIGTRKCLIEYPQYRGALTPDIEKWEEFLKKNHPDSEALIKEPVPAQAQVEVKPCKTVKKKKISAAVKRLVWNTNIGEDIGKSKCMCCESTDITQLSFNCGHIIAEAKGGDTIVSNLRPICQNCNSSMGTINMNEFMKSLK